jgi:tetratricopeptide (TPR) repeat protein
VSSCSRNQASSLERAAIVPANILISDPNSEWMSLGIALALEQDFATSHRITAVLANGDSGAYQHGATQVLRTTVEDRRGRINIHVTVTNLATQRITSSGDVNLPSSAGVLATVNAVAKRIDPQSTEFSTKNDRAWQAYTVAAGSSSVQTRVQMLNGAVNADPAFGLAYLVLAQVLNQAGDQNLAPLLSAAAAHRAAFTPLDKARFDALVARTSHAPLEQQANVTAAVLQLAPNDVDALATLGSERFLQNNATEGERLLNRALELSPGNVNIRAQLAEGLLETRRFAEAEKIFTSINNSPAVLPQLAVCSLLKGDPGRANTVFSNYLKERAAANDPLLYLAQANWIAISKSPAEGVQYLARNNFSKDDLRSLAFSQSSIWQLMGNGDAARNRLVEDFAGAKKNAALASQFAKAPVPKLFAAIAILMSQSDEPLDQWREQVNRSPLDDGIKHTVLAYGLFLSAHYAEAVAEWQALIRQSGGADLRARAMLAASLNRAGRAAEARKIPVQAFAPNLTGADQFAVLPFREMRVLLGLYVY